MVVGLLVVELRVPGSRSLKDKRRVVRSILEQSRAMHPASASEVDGLGLLDYATLAFVVVTPANGSWEQVLRRIEDEIYDRPDAEVLSAVQSSWRP